MMLAFALSVSALPWLAHAVPGEASEGQQRAKLAAIAMSGKTDAHALAAFLRDRDPVVAAAAFDALRENDSAAAARALLAVVEDTTEPTRLRALQLLVSGGDVNDANVLSALRTALNDPDSALVAHAVQTLTGRDDPAADYLLTDAMREGSVATRLLIVRSVGTGDGAQRYLYDGLHDSDETVRRAARAVLFPDRDGSDIR
jgi:HEAT repeat protein